MRKIDAWEMRRRIEQIYRDVIATTPLSTTFDHGRLKDAYTHGIYMVAEHTVSLMAERLLEVLQEFQQEREYTDGSTGIQMTISQYNPDYPGHPKITITGPIHPVLLPEQINEALARLRERAGLTQEELPDLFTFRKDF